MNYRKFESIYSCFYRFSFGWFLVLRLIVIWLKKEVELRLTLGHHWFSSPLKSEKKYLHAVFTAKLNVCAHIHSAKKILKNLYIFLIVADRKTLIRRFSIDCWHVTWKPTKFSIRFWIQRTAYYTGLVKNFRLFFNKKEYFLLPRSETKRTWPH